MVHGACIVKMPKTNFAFDEIVDMVERCGLNMLSQFPPFLIAHIRRSRSDPKVLSVLKNMKRITFGGTVLPKEEEEWACSQQMPLLNVFASTETGMTLASALGEVELRPVTDSGCIFQPALCEESLEGADVVRKQILELVIPPISLCCPDESYCAADGNFYTGDLFHEVRPGVFVYQGRNDDWVKTDNALRCNTKAIEDEVHKLCSDLVLTCVAVGHMRPAPTLFVEPANLNIDHDTVKAEIVRRLKPFSDTRYVHEKMVNPNHIIVVEPNVLPRTATKGNIRRQAVEQMFKVQLDALYGVSL